VSSPPRERLHQHDIDHRGFVDHQQVAGEWIVVATLEAAVLRVDLQEPMDGLGLEAGRLGHALGGAAGRSAEQKPHPLGGKNAEDRHIEFRYAIPSAGPHGLDLDPDSHRLFCACVAVAKAAVTIDRERRVIRNLSLEIKPAEPAIGKVELDLLTQLAF
jgi:hypothetical protein